MGRKLTYKLAFLISHPIQYQVPLFRALANRSDIDLTVLYCSNHGATEKKDEGFGVSFKWDIDMLSGYRSKVLRNYSPFPSVDRSFGLINIAIIREVLFGNYDAIIIHGYIFTTNILAFLAATVRGLPIFFRGETVLRSTPLTLFSLLRKTYLRWLFRRTRACLTIGSKSEEFYRAFGVPDDRLFFTPYSVDNDFFSKKADALRPENNRIKRELGLPDIPLMLFCGKLIDRKRPRDLLRAFLHIPPDKAALAFVGDGEQRKELEKMAHDSGAQNVIFVGFQNQQSIVTYYAIADIFVLPSAREVSPLVLNEAMCCSLPLIVSDAIPSCYDFVDIGKNGYIFPLGDIDRLVFFISDLLSDASKRKKFGMYSREKIKQWTVDKCVDGIVEALKNQL